MTKKERKAFKELVAAAEEVLEKPSSAAARRLKAAVLDVKEVPGYE